MKNNYPQGARDFGSQGMHFAQAIGPMPTEVPMSWEQRERVARAVELGAQKFARETRELRATAMLMGESS